jgi:hypothetical protein
MLALHWLVHGSVDWFWEFPALGAIALFGLAVAARLGASLGGLATTRSRHAAPGAGLATLGAALGIALLGSFALPFLSARNTATAARTWRADPAAARSRLSSARSLNPLSDQPDLYAAAIASRLHDWPWMQSSLEDAIAREDASWYSHFELALVYSVRHERRKALQQLAIARVLNRGEQLIRDASREVRAGKRVSVARFDKLLIERNLSLSR